MAISAITLDDKYAAETGQVFLTGTQALVRLPMMQYRRDQAAGLNTACYISGYRGSPLGNFDRALWQAKAFLEQHRIHFQPGVNEDLAATAIWGTQQIGLYGDAKYDGVFALWYGKGPGVDRSIDALKHANNAGSAHHGGVLALAGDDHICASSTLPHQSEYDFVAAQMPVINPAGIQEFLDFGLKGWALSRYSGLWVGFICVAETMDGSAIVSVDPERVRIVLPTDYSLPPGGLNIRWPDPPLDQERRLHEHKMDAALAFARANRLDRVIMDSPRRRFGIITTGKAYLDVRQALDELGLDHALAEALGLALYKIGMSWPLEPTGVRAFAAGLEDVLVIEEKRGLIESQLKEILYDLPTGRRPRILGKRDQSGAWLLPSAHELSPTMVARAIARHLPGALADARVKARLSEIETREAALTTLAKPKLERIPYFCAGCPHNSSTRVPEGSRALAGIGCHFMAQWMDRETQTYTHMGGEGANWIGQSPFTTTPHVFQNLGDGTYFHSGILAVRAAVSAKVNVTYKILFNDAVAMTGGQPMDGPLTVPALTHQLSSEGVRRIAVVSDEPEKYGLSPGFAPDVTVHHRDTLDAVQRELRGVEGVSAIVYDQMCATEKRRKRKRGTLGEPDWRVVINSDICEGCGDCSYQSNCLAVVPLETEFGRKRTIDQSACNKDYSCVKGFCPSFVLVKGGRLRKGRAAADLGLDQRLTSLPEPACPSGEAPYSILIAGVGGMGVVTLGALLGTAAHIEGKGATVLDKIGLAQKYGAVTCHVRIAPKQEDLHAARIAVGGAELLLGADLVVSASHDVIARLARGKSRALINAHELLTGDFTHNPDLAFPAGALKQQISAALDAPSVHFFDASRAASALLGDAIATNLYLLGFACQKGYLPVSTRAIEAAITLNAVAVEANLRAFRWGRLAVHDPAFTAAMIGSVQSERPPERTHTLDELIERRAADLAAYQNPALAGRYRALIARVREAEAMRAPGFAGLAQTVAQGYHKLLAYKDEYEIARLYTDGRFKRRIADQFEGGHRLQFSLAPPLFAARDPESGLPKKAVYGPWLMPVFHLLARLKGLRGTAFDPFGYSAERRLERRLIGAYERTVDILLQGLTPDHHPLAVEIAALPLVMRGFGHIKLANVASAKETETKLLAAYRDPGHQASAAE